MSLNTTPRTWVAGEVVTAAEMNTETRDAVTGLEAAWSTYVPITTQITLGNGTLTGRSNRVGKTIDFVATFTFGSTSAIAAAPTFTLPVTALSINWSSFDCNALDTSASQWYPFGAIATSTGVVTLRPLPTTAGNPFGGVGPSTPFIWATGDVLSVSGRYEAA